VHVNDKATAVFPPYAAGAQRAFTEDARDRVARRLWNWSEADARRFFLAGGGSEGGEFYLVAGRKHGQA
jgi:hypothetical protein